ncbi:MAG: hypothetical protein DLM72_07800 [Candidatus Nitrosopolaris wilkensis]|nr:MAG: hypothetical protein DLM72_07800 [Candidatus Nitrosopolaris wilkensis]
MRLIVKNFFDADQRITFEVRLVTIIKENRNDSTEYKLVLFGKLLVIESIRRQAANKGRVN